MRFLADFRLGPLAGIQLVLAVSVLLVGDRSLAATRSLARNKIRGWGIFIVLNKKSNWVLSLFVDHLKTPELTLRVNY